MIIKDFKIYIKYYYDHPLDYDSRAPIYSKVISRFNIEIGEFGGFYPGGIGLGGLGFGTPGPCEIILPLDEYCKDRGFDKFNLNIYVDTSNSINGVEYILFIKNQDSQFINDINIFPKDGLTEFKLNQFIIENYSKNVYLRHGYLDKVNITRGGHLSFESVTIGKGTIELSSKNKIIFKNSNLGETTFNNLKEIDVQIKNSNISKIQLNNVKFQEIIVDDMDTPEIKELYRHIKYLYDSIGNKTEANKFFAKEMEYHMKELRESGNTKDYCITKLQKEVSNFGNDWLKAFSWYLMFTLLCYILYSGFDFISHEWINIWSDERFMVELSRLTQMLNPIPKVEDITNPLLLLFSLIKILIVYQIAVALRRISQR